MSQNIYLTYYFGGHLLPDQSNSSLNHNDRSIRVFVSSTFKDMKEERDILVKQIFPQIRKICEDRAVTFTDIDLRWGISDEQKAEGEVLPICLETIEQCRPYFIGILGERYGWIQKTIPDELAEEESWLKEHTDKSITELEIMHGVLNNPSMEKNALFYLRYPSYVDSVSSEEKEELIETPLPEEIEQFGLKKANELAEKRRQKLQSLKQEIRNSPFPVTEYMSPKELGEAVLKDLTALVNEKYPEDTKPDPHEQETLVHEAFARERTGVYIENADLLESLDKHAESVDQPLVILGDSGSGKSALLANWVLQYREKHPDEMVFTHFIGATSTSTDWEAMLRRIMLELRTHFDIQQDIPEDKNELRLAFANWLHMASAQGSFVLIIDALNQLEDRDGAQDLVWLPPMMPENVRLIVSTLPGRSLDVLKEREWRTLEVPLQDIERRKTFIPKYLAQYGKNPPYEQVDMIASYPQTSNPLYLRSLLEELRLHGEHFTVDRQFAWYLEARTVEELFDKILTRWERDYESERPGLVRDTMRYIWASRKGLSESELAGILGNGDDDPLPKAYWISLYLAAEKSLVNKSGLIDFFHDYLRNAVKKRYLPDEKNEINTHLQLSRYFKSKEIDARIVYERPWQLNMAKRWDELYGLLSNPQWLQSMWRLDQYDVKTYWAKIESRSRYKIVDTYNLASEKGISNDFYFLIVADLLYSTGNLEKAMDGLKEEELICRELKDKEGLQICLGVQTEILLLWGQLEEALKLSRQQEQICREINNKNGLQMSKGNQALVLLAWGQLEEAMELNKQQEQICREINQKQGIQLSKGIQAVILLAWGQLEEAMELSKQQEQICREINQKQGLQMSKGIQAVILLSWGQLEEAMELLKQQEQICREMDNKNSLSMFLGIQALILRSWGQLEEAMELSKQQEQICREINQKQGLQMSKGNQAEILLLWGQLKKAMNLNRQQEQICREMNYKYGLSISLGIQAEILQSWGLLEEAMELLKQQEQIYREMQYKDGLSSSLSDQALILLSWGQLEETIELFKQKEQICREMNNKNGLSMSLGIQAKLLRSRGQLEEAMELLKQQEQIYREMQYKDGLSSSLSDQALILLSWGQLEEAMELSKQQEQICRELNNKEGLHESLGDQALILRSWGQLEEAMELSKQQEQIRGEISNKEGLQKSRGREAFVLKSWEQMEEAMELSKQQVAILDERRKQLEFIESLKQEYKIWMLLHALNPKFLWVKFKEYNIKRTYIKYTYRLKHLLKVWLKD